MEYVITAGIIAAVVILILICILSTWRNGTVVVKIKNDQAMIRSAVEQFNCGKESETRQHIVDTARDVCEGRLREIIADMTAEQLYKDRKTFSVRV